MIFINQYRPPQAGDRVLVCIRPAGWRRSTRLGSASRTFAEFCKRSKNQTSKKFTQQQRASLVPQRDGQNPCTLLRFGSTKKQKNVKKCISQIGSERWLPKRGGPGGQFPNLMTSDLTATQVLHMSQNLVHQEMAKISVPSSVLKTLQSKKTYE